MTPPQTFAKSLFEKSFSMLPARVRAGGMLGKRPRGRGLGAIIKQALRLGCLRRLLGGRDFSRDVCEFRCWRQQWHAAPIGELGHV